MVALAMLALTMVAMVSLWKTPVPLVPLRIAIAALVPPVPLGWPRGAGSGLMRLPGILGGVTLDRGGWRWRWRGVGCGREGWRRVGCPGRRSRG